MFFERFSKVSLIFFFRLFYGFYTCYSLSYKACLSNFSGFKVINPRNQGVIAQKLCNYTGPMQFT